MFSLEQYGLSNRFGEGGRPLVALQTREELGEAAGTVRGDAVDVPESRNMPGMTSMLSTAIFMTIGGPNTGLQVCYKKKHQNQRFPTIEKKQVYIDLFFFDDPK